MGLEGTQLMNYPKVPALLARRLGLTTELAHCTDCEEARASSLARDAVCKDHYVGLHRELTRPGPANRSLR
jgi:hypothetical protein